jgi:hypothetical protein
VVFPDFQPVRLSEELVCIYFFRQNLEAVRHEREIQSKEKLNFFAEIDQCKPVLLGHSLAGNLVKPLMSLYGTE